MVGKETKSPKRPARMHFRGAERVSSRPSSQAPRAVVLASASRAVERLGVLGTPMLMLLM